MNRLLKIISVFILLLGCHTFNAQETYYNEKPDSIAKIITIKGTVYTGSILSDDGKILTIESAEVGKIVIDKIDIKKIQYIKNTEQNADGSKLSLYEYGFAPTAFNLQKNQVSLQNHYFAYWVVEYGITDNISIDAGITYPLVMPIKFGLKSSVKLAEDLRLGVKANAYVTMDYYGLGSHTNNTSTIITPFSMGYNASGMLTIGDPSINLTVGGTYYNFDADLVASHIMGYALFLGGHKQFKDKLGLSMELLYLQDYTQTSLFSFGVLLKYFRSPIKVFTIGLETPTFPRVNAFSTHTATQYLVIPLPYVGFRKLF